MILITKRLVLRQWEESDAEDLYKYAKDPRVGPFAGWKPHTGIDESKEIIKSVLSAEETYAVCLKEDCKAIGSVSLKLNGVTDMTDRDDEAEIGYWIGVPFWGNGYIPEAVMEIERHAFEDLKITRLWCGYYDGNEKSRRVQEKCGFKYHHTTSGIYVSQFDEIRTGHVSTISREEWLKFFKK